MTSLGGEQELDAGPKGANAPALTICPYCNSTSPHHWPDGCISLLTAEGLAICKKILEGQRRIWVESRLGGGAGAIFHFKIPKKQGGAQ